MLIEFVSPMLHGLILAAGLVMPFGMQNVFIFNQGAAQNSIIKALPSILTACFCDTILIVSAVLGISMIIMENLWAKYIIFAGGGIFLFYMGYSLWIQPAKTRETRTYLPLSPTRQILFAASVSIFNPHAIIDTVAVIGTSALAYSGYSKVVYTITCVLVSWAWFFGLSLFGSKLNQLDKTGRMLLVINKVAALIMWAIGTYLLYQLYQFIVF